MSGISSFVSKDIHSQIHKLWNMGGPYQKAADKVKSIVYTIERQIETPASILSKIALTNHGESRIKHCIKYDLTGFCRLVTIQNDNFVVLIYFGTHEEVDHWLDVNKGLQLGITDLKKGLFEVYLSNDITDSENRVSAEREYSDGFLFSRLKQYYNVISKSLKPFVKRSLESITTMTSEDDILEIAQVVDDQLLQDAIFDTFILLRGGKVDEAKNRILSYEDQISLIAELPKKEVESVASNDTFIRINDLGANDLRVLLENHQWLDWMLFMHPDQREVVDKDFSGSARLLGVSGSGKTCVVVKRSVRLAKMYPNEKVLILTLNESLAKLIRKLLEKLLADDSDKTVGNYIEVKSFAELCRDIILSLHPEKHKQLRSLNFKTDKHETPIDDVWSEYYTCQLYNNDAEVLFPVHQTLLARGIFPQEYLKQEVDWIRSFFPQDQRVYYLKETREGRSIPFNELERKLILDGLQHWETKMKDVGAIDYLGLANLFSHYSDQVIAKYRCILVDEVQDFGTLELKLIRRLVEDNENDLFLTGDIAQQVYNKHHKLKHAGINILPGAWMKILKNYRNSRQILEAAYSMYSANVNSDLLKSDDFEILNPEYANFSSPKPFIRKAESVNEEFAFAYQYLNENLDPHEKGCIAICGYSIFDISAFGKQQMIQVLDDDIELDTEKIFLSDLEQTKGFEFDKMIIINCSKGVIPNPKLPQEEWYREVSKMYVAMTRAKKDLIISFSVELSGLFENSLSFFTADTWQSHVRETPRIFTLPENTYMSKSKRESWKMTGKDFVYDFRSVGMSRDLQNKLIENVNGKSVTNERGGVIGWKTMLDLRNDMRAQKRDIPTLTRVFGASVIKELEQFLKI